MAMARAQTKGEILRKGQKKALPKTGEPLINQCRPEDTDHGGHQEADLLMSYKNRSVPRYKGNHGSERDHPGKDRKSRTWHPVH